MKTAAKGHAQDGKQVKDRQRAPLATPTDLSAAATRAVSGAMNASQ
jgi:hypothetical protein